MKFYALPFLVLIAGLVACGQPQPYSPSRPSTLPPQAVYAGGEDGGDWVACEGNDDGALHCRIFDPRSGDLRREAWFRYCPKLFPDSSGAPAMLDARGLLISRARLLRDRPDIFHPPTNTTPNQIQREEDLAIKYYELEGVDSNCHLVANKKN